MRVALVMLFLFLTASFANAQEALKIGHVDLQRALNESNAGKGARAELEEMVKLRQAMIEEKVKAKEQKAAEFQRQASVLSEDARVKKQDELAGMEREIKRLIDDSNSEVQKVQRDKEVGILKDLEALITKMAEDGNYTVIFPSDVVLYSVDKVDITDEVIRRYNEKTGEKGGGKPAK